MTRIWNALNLPQVMTLHVAFWVVVDLILLGRSNNLSKSDWASWVQAVGSIAAILGLVWAALHATTTGKREAEKNAREASIAQLIFLRSVLASAGIVTRDLEYYARAFNGDRVVTLSKSLDPLLQTIESLAMRASDQEIARLIALTYEHLILCQAHTASIKPKLASGFMSAELSAKFNQIHIEKTLADLDQVGARLGAPPRPPDE